MSLAGEINLTRLHKIEFTKAMHVFSTELYSNWNALSPIKQDEAKPVFLSFELKYFDAIEAIQYIVYKLQAFNHI